MFLLTYLRYCHLLECSNRLPSPLEVITYSSHYIGSNMPSIETPIYRVTHYNYFQPSLNYKINLAKNCSLYVTYLPDRGVWLRENRIIKLSNIWQGAISIIWHLSHHISPLYFPSKFLTLIDKSRSQVSGNTVFSGPN